MSYNRKARRAAGRKNPLPDAQFRRELAKAVAGDPSADPSVARFYKEFAETNNIIYARHTSDGLEVLRTVS